MSQLGLSSRRWMAALAGLAFVAGMLLVPILHTIHCAGAHDSHNADQCPVCQAASAPVIAAAPHIEPVAQAIVSVRIHIPQSLTPFAPLSDSAQARGPPAA